MEFNEWIDIGYLIAAALFIFGLKKLGHPRKEKQLLLIQGMEEKIQVHHF